MARIYGGRVSISATPQVPTQPLQLLAGARMNQGMIVDLDPNDLPNEALTNALNARCRVDRISRRPGTALWTPTAPDANPVLLVMVLKKADGTAYTLRFTPSTINRRGPVSWTLLTTGTALTGGPTDRIQAVVVLDELAFTNGVDRIYKLNAGVT